MKRLLQETCKKVSVRTEKRLSDNELVNLQKRYRNTLTRGEKELPIIPPKPSGKRGKLAKSDAHNLWERLKKHEAAVLLFAKDRHVSFTNNRTGGDLRMAKVKQKVSGCFESSGYAHAYCRILSYLQSMANKGYNILIWSLHGLKQFEQIICYKCCVCSATINKRTFRDNYIGALINYFLFSPCKFKDKPFGCMLRIHH